VDYAKMKFQKNSRQSPKFLAKHDNDNYKIEISTEIGACLILALQAFVFVFLLEHF